MLAKRASRGRGTWLSLALLCSTFAWGCSSSHATTTASGGSSAASMTSGSMTSGSGGAGGSGGSGGAGTIEPIAVSLSCEPGPYSACGETRPLPSEVATLIDLSDPDKVVGRCDSPVQTWDPANHTVLPNDAAAYPLVVHVSASGFEGPCSDCVINGVTPATTYGVALSLPYALWEKTGQTAILAVNEPWSIVAGGCGEACAIACLEGYQEFQPTGCLGSYARDFGIATDVPNPPDAYLLVDLADNEPLPCCPWQCQQQ